MQSPSIHAMEGSKYPNKVPKQANLTSNFQATQFPERSLPTGKCPHSPSACNI